MFLALAQGQAHADTNKAWTLESQSGQVHLVRSGISPVSLTDGDVFSGGDWIETGPDGRAVLRRGEETIVVAPGSRIGLPKENTGPFATRILQSLGTILLTVEKQAKQHFEVQTPYLTAVVKGTTFTVGIQGERAVVHVVEGLVEVQNLASGRSSLVRPGQTGSVLRNGPAEVEVQGAANGDQTPASQTPAGQTPSVSVPGAIQAAAPATDAVEAGRDANAIAITETLGAKPLDLKSSTRGLIRVAVNAAPLTKLGQEAQNLTDTTQLSARSNLTDNSLVGSTGASISAGLDTGSGLALNQSASVGAGGGTGLALNQSLSVGAGGDGGLGLTQSVDLGVGGGDGLSVDLGLSANLGETNVVGQVVNTVTQTVSKVGGGLLGGLLGGHEK